MNHQEKQTALSGFSARMNSIISKTEAAIKNKNHDDYPRIDYEFNRLKEDFQKLAGHCAAHDQGVFQFG